MDGILVQLPLPSHLNPLEILEKIDPSKDIDGFHPMNMGKLLLGQKGGFIPCTPYESSNFSGITKSALKIGMWLLSVAAILSANH